MSPVRSFCCHFRTRLRQESVLCGFSSGGAVTAALRVAARPDMAGKRIVCVIQSFGERYLSRLLPTRTHARAHTLEKERTVK
jgi:hypothetical protein